MARSYQRVVPANAEALSAGWQNPAIPASQRSLVERQLQMMADDDAPDVFRVAASAVDALRAPVLTVVEVGCSSAYYADVFRTMCKSQIHYTGVDYSEEFVRQAHRERPLLPVLAGDATRLPLRDRTFDVVFSAAVLMHVPDWRRGVAETVRVAREAVVFHRTPVHAGAETAAFRKRAYGVWVPEYVFGETQFLDVCRSAGLEPAEEWLVSDFQVPGIGRAKMKTYLMKRRAG
jgi:SAM-dependent methyltransferase